MTKEQINEAYIRALKRLIEEAEESGFTYLRREENNFRDKILEEVFRGIPDASLSGVARQLLTSRETLRKVYQSNGLTLEEWKAKIMEER